MRFPPYSVIVTWPKSDHSNPVRQGPALLAVELTSLPIALICLSLRMYVRLVMLRRSWWDDWIMVFGAVFGIGMTVTSVLATKLYGWDIHIWDLPLELATKGRQISITGQTMFIISSGLIKTSILVGYLRIAPSRSLFRRLVWWAIALGVALTVIFVIVLWTECKPASSYWNLFLSQSECEVEGPQVMAQMVTSVFTDFTVYALPMHTFYKLQLPFAQRFILMLLFGMGTVVVVAGCMRTYWIHYVLYETYDVTWEGYYMWIWSAVEINLGIICGCVPSLKALLFPAGVKSSTYSGSGSGGATIGSGRQRRRWYSDMELQTKIEMNRNMAEKDTLVAKPDARSITEDEPSIPLELHLPDERWGSLESFLLFQEAESSRSPRHDPAARLNTDPIPEHERSPGKSVAQDIDLEGRDLT